MRLYEANWGTHAYLIFYLLFDIQIQSLQNPKKIVKSIILEVRCFDCDISKQNSYFISRYQEINSFVLFPQNSFHNLFHCLDKL